MTRQHVHTFDIRDHSDLLASRVKLRALANDYNMPLRTQSRLFWALTHVGNLLLALGDKAIIEVFHIQDEEDTERLGLLVSYSGPSSDRLQRMCSRWFDETTITVTDQPQLDMSIWSY